MTLAEVAAMVMAAAGMEATVAPEEVERSF